MNSRKNQTVERHLVAVPDLVQASAWTELSMFVQSNEIAIVDPTRRFRKDFDYLIQPNVSVSEQRGIIVVGAADAAQMLRVIARVVPARAWSRDDDNVWRSFKLPGPEHDGPIISGRLLGEELLLGETPSLQKLLDHLELPAAAQLQVDNQSAPTAIRFTPGGDKNHALTAKQRSVLHTAIDVAATSADVEVSFI